MGLGVAYQLSRLGYAPVVFETDDRVGGMAASFDFGGVSIERYYHFYCLSDQSLFQTLEELDLTESLRWVNTTMGYWYQDRLQSWGTPVSLLQFRGLKLIDKLRYGIHAFVSVRRNSWRALDKIDAATWIRRWTGERTFRALWQNLFEYKFYDEAENVSAAWIWSRIRRLGRSRESLSKEKLGYIQGGTSTLLNEMANSVISRGGSIKLGTPVREIRVRENKVSGIVTDQGIENFDCVVSTVPLPLLPTLAPDLPQWIIDKIKSIRNIAVVCVIAKLNKSVSKNFWLNTNDDSMDIPGLVEYSNLRPMDDHIIYVPFYLPLDHPTFLESDDCFVSKVKTYLRRINSEIEDSDFLDVRVSRYKFAQPICSPGFLDKLPPIQLPIDGLWAADTSYYYPEDRGLSESISLGRKIAVMIDTKMGYQ